MQRLEIIYSQNVCSSTDGAEVMLVRLEMEVLLLVALVHDFLPTAVISILMHAFSGAFFTFIQKVTFIQKGEPNRRAHCDFGFIVHGLNKTYVHTKID